MPRRSSADAELASARLQSETQIPLADLAGLPLTLGGEVYHPSAVTLRRWGADGRGHVYLDTAFCHQRQAWVTSRAALERFAAAVAGSGAVAHPHPENSSPNEHGRAHGG
jgi:hypothetical protein